MRSSALATLFVSMLGTALMAGFFYAYSVSVMPGLGRASPGSAIGGMQGINEAVRNPLFFSTFFLTPVVMTVGALMLLCARLHRAGFLTAVAVAVYLAGVIAPTAMVHMPLNESLAGAGDLAGSEAASRWANFTNQWNAWNHLRSVAPVIGFALLATALHLVMSNRQAPRPADSGPRVRARESEGWPQRR